MGLRDAVSRPHSLRLVVAPLLLLLLLGLSTTHVSATIPSKLSAGAQMFYATNMGIIARTDLNATQTLITCAEDAHDVVAMPAGDGGGATTVFWTDGANVFSAPVPTETVQAPVDTACPPATATALITSGLPDGADIFRLAFDHGGGTDDGAGIYFTEATSKAIMRVPAAGGAASVVIAFEDLMGPPLGVATLRDADLLAWSVAGEDWNGTSRRGLATATMAGNDVTWRFGYSSPWEARGVELAMSADDPEVVMCLWVEDRSGNEVAIQGVSDVSAGSWSPRKEVSGRNGAADAYIAADIDEDMVWFSDAHENGLYTAVISIGSYLQPIVFEHEDEHPKGIFFGRGFPALPIDAPLTRYPNRPDGGGTGDGGGSGGSGGGPCNPDADPDCNPDDGATLLRAGFATAFVAVALAAAGAWVV